MFELTEDHTFCRTKVIMYTLLRSFRFSLAFDANKIHLGGGMFMWPHLKDEVDKGSQMPLWVSAVEESD